MCTYLMCLCLHIKYIPNYMHVIMLVPVSLFDDTIASSNQNTGAHASDINLYLIIPFNIMIFM